MNPDDVLKWVQVWNSLLALGVPIAKLVMIFRAMLTPEQVAEVLRGVKAGWIAAEGENDGRVAELEALVALGGGDGL